MTKRGMGLVVLAVLGGCVGGVASRELVDPKPATAQDNWYEEQRRRLDKQQEDANRALEEAFRQLHEDSLARMGALKMQIIPINPKRCIGLSVVVAPSNGTARVFRAFEDGRVEQFRAQSALWENIEVSGVSP